MLILLALVPGSYWYGMTYANLERLHACPLCVEDTNVQLNADLLQHADAAVNAACSCRLGCPDVLSSCMMRSRDHC